MVSARLRGELQTEALWVLEPESITLERGFDSGRRQPSSPEPERLVRAHAHRDPVDHARAGPASDQPRILEEGEIGAWAAVLVGVEEVVDGGVVLVDRLLDQPQAH